MKRDTVVNTLYLNPEPRLGSLRGLIPFGVAVSPDQKRLYVAEAGLNAVAVVDVPTLKVLGHIPTGWFPSKLKVSPDGQKLIVTNAKGYGSGPNGGSTFTLGPEGSYIGSLMKGTVSVMDIPADAELPALTQKVLDNNYRFTQVAAENDNPIPPYPRCLRVAHQAHRVHRQGEPHLRRGVRAIPRRQRRGGSGPLRAEPGLHQPRQETLRHGRRRHAQPPRFIPPIRHVGQLLLRLRRVGRRPPLARQHLPQRVGRDGHRRRVRRAAQPARHLASPR